MLADRALDSVERLLLSLPPHKLGFVGDDASVAAQREIESGTHQLETLLNASIDKNFDLFELYTVRNILSVDPRDRPYMRLAHYHGLDLPSSSDHDPHRQNDDDADRPSVESVTALRRRLQASQRLRIALEAESARNDTLLRDLRALLGLPSRGPDDEAAAAAADHDEGPREPRPSPFGFLAEKDVLSDSGGDQPMTTTAEFALSQLQALRSLSVSLRTLLPDLGAPDPAPGPNAPAADDGKQHRSWRRERAEYVEASSRKYLERVAGLELGPAGDVRDGEWSGEGRRLTRDEVEGLERVADVLAGGGRGGTGKAGGAAGDRGDEDAPATRDEA